MSSIKSLASETQTYSRAREKHNPEKGTIVKLLLVLLDPTDKGVYYSWEILIFFMIGSANTLFVYSSWFHFPVNLLSFPKQPLLG